MGTPQVPPIDRWALKSISGRLEHEELGALTYYLWIYIVALKAARAAAHHGDQCRISAMSGHWRAAEVATYGRAQNVELLRSARTAFDLVRLKSGAR